jgi:hypothetical protein
MKQNEIGAFGTYSKKVNNLLKTTNESEVKHISQQFKIIAKKFNLTGLQACWFEEYVLLNNVDYDWNWSTELWVDDNNEYDLISSPWPCICAAMLRFDVSGYATILAGNNARMVVAILGLMSQGMSVNDVSRLVDRHDSIDMMEIENRFYRDPTLKFVDLDKIHKLLTFTEFLGYRHPEILYPDRLYDDPVNIEKMVEIFNEYKKFNHADREEVRRIEEDPKYTELEKYTWSLEDLE